VWTLQLLTVVWCLWCCLAPAAFVGLRQQQCTHWNYPSFRKSIVGRLAQRNKDVFSEGTRVLLRSPPALKGKTGTIVRRVKGDAVAVRMDSGSVFNINTENIQDTFTVKDAWEGLWSSKQKQSWVPTPKVETAEIGNPTPAPAAVRIERIKTEAKKTSAKPAQQASRMKKKDKEEDVFSPGQQVVLRSPPALSGMPGTVLRRLVAEDAFAVRLESGSVFNIKKENLKAAVKAGFFSPLTKSLSQMFGKAEGSATKVVQKRAAQNSRAPDTKQGEMSTPARKAVQSTPSRPEVLMQTPAIAMQTPAKQAEVRANVGAAEDVARASSRAQAARSSQTASASRITRAQRGKKKFFYEGQQVVLLSPPALAGKQGEIVQKVSGSSEFAVRLESGSVFNINTQNLQAVESVESGGITGSGIGGGRSGSGGGSGGGDGAGKPPTGSRSGATSGPQKHRSGFMWILVALSCAVLLYGGLLLRKKWRVPSTTRLPRIDIRPLQSSSGAAGPLGALLILAALLTAKACRELLPAVLAWLQEHVSLKKVQTHAATLRTSVDVDTETESEGFTVLDVFLLVAVMGLAISWSSAGSLKKSKYAAARAAISKTLAETHKAKPKSKMSRAQDPRGDPEGEEVLSPRCPSREEPVLKTLGKAPLAWDTANRRVNSSRSQSSLPAVPEDTEVQHDEAKPEEEESLLDTLDTNLLDGTWSSEENYHIDLPRVHFQVNMQSKPGDRLLAVGGDANLGNWVPDKSQMELFTDEVNYPIWTGTWSPCDSPAEHHFKLVLVKANGAVFWESIENRSLYVLPSDELEVATEFNSSGFQILDYASGEISVEAAGG